MTEGCKCALSYKEINFNTVLVFCGYKLSPHLVLDFLWGKILGNKGLYPTLRRLKQLAVALFGQAAFGP